MAKDTNVESAREISTELLHTFEKLNAKVEDIRKHCNWYLCIDIYSKTDLFNN